MQKSCNCKIGNYFACKSPFYSVSLMYAVVVYSCDLPFLVPNVLNWVRAGFMLFCLDYLMMMWQLLQSVFSQLISACLFYCIQKHRLAVQGLTNCTYNDEHAHNIHVKRFLGAQKLHACESIKTLSSRTWMLWWRVVSVSESK